MNRRNANRVVRLSPIACLGIAFLMLAPGFLSAQGAECWKFLDGDAYQQSPPYGPWICEPGSFVQWVIQVSNPQSPQKTYTVIDDPAQYYDYAVSAVILHQLHRYICDQILGQDVRSANYYGNTQVGIYLESILSAGATRDWNRLLYEATGESLSASALLDYYEPLLAWLAEQNAGREVGFR